MKKFTLALSAVLMSASAAMALDFGSSYVLVPADAATQAQGKYLAATADGLAYTNDLSAATLWEYNGEQLPDWSVVNWFSNDGKYLKFAEGETATLSDDIAYAYPEFSSEVEGAYYLTNYSLWAYPTPTDRAFLNAVNLTGEPENSAACAYYIVEADAETTTDDIETALFSLIYPNAKIFACTNSKVREFGKYLGITEDGTLTTTNTLDINAAWNVTQSPDGFWYVQNLGTKGYLYTDGLTLSETPVELQITDSPAVIGAVGINKNTEASTSDYSWLNALNTRAGVGTWNLDAGSSFFQIAYSPEVSAEAVDAKVDVLLAQGPVLDKATKAMACSSIGSSMGFNYLQQIRNAETVEELNAAGEAAISAAYNFAMQNMSYNFSLFNNNQQNFINYVPDSDLPFQRGEMITSGGLWVAEELDAEVYPPLFMLKNVSSGKYIGPRVSSPADCMSAVDADEAIQFQLEAGNKGLTLKVAENSYLSVFNGDKLALVTWVDVNDANSVFSFLDLPSLDQDEAWIDFGGEYSEDPNMFGKQFTAINSVEIAVPVNAVLSGGGKVTFGLGTGEWDENWNSIIDVQQTWTAEDLAAITPVIRDVTTEVWDDEIWDYVEKTTTCAVYVLPLDETYTECDVEYVARGEAGLFIVNTDEGAVVSGPLYNSTFIDEPWVEPGFGPIDVTPVAGKVENISVIAIGEGWYTDPESVSRLRVEFNGTVAKDANGMDIDADAVDLDTRYCGLDWTYNIPVNFTEAGTYVMTIGAAMFINEDEYIYNEDTTIEWVIEEKDGIFEITSVKVNSKEIYDLNGRKVSNPAPGLYIIDGRKTLVK